MGERCGALLRVSSGRQDEEHQEPQVNDWITSHGYELAKTTRLRGYSAFKGEQEPALDEFLDLMRAGIITVLVAWTDDRVERRGAAHLLMLIWKARQAGGRIEFASPGSQYLNSSNDMSDVNLALAATMARLEVERKRERNLAARKTALKNGGNTDRYPFGYTSGGDRYKKEITPTDEGRRLIGGYDEPGGEHIPGVYERCINGESLRDIAAWLTSQTGTPWWETSVGRLIRNPAFRGTQVSKTGKFIRDCPPIVSASIWKRANEALTSRRDVRRASSKPRPERAMLGYGALRCPFCENSPMYRILTGADPVQQPKYRCTGLGPGRKGCGNLIRTDIADETVNKLIATHFAVYRRITAIQPGNRADIEAGIDQCKLDQRQLALEDLDDSEYDRRLAEIRARRKTLENTPIIEDTITEQDSGERWSDLWEAVPVSERGPWLRKNGWKVTASKWEITIGQGDRVAVATLTPDD